MKSIIVGILLLGQVQHSFTQEETILIHLNSLEGLYESNSFIDLMEKYTEIGFDKIIQSASLSDSLKIAHYHFYVHTLSKTKNEQFNDQLDSLAEFVVRGSGISRSFRFANYARILSYYGSYKRDKVRARKYALMCESMIRNDHIADELLFEYYSRLGRYYYQRFNKDSVIVILEKAAEIADRIELTDNESAFFTYRLLASNYYFNNEINQSISTYNKSWYCYDKDKKLIDPMLAAMTAYSNAEVLNNAYNPEAAYYMLGKARKILRTAGVKNPYMSTLIESKKLIYAALLGDSHNAITKHDSLVTAAMILYPESDHIINSLLMDQTNLLLLAGSEGSSLETAIKAYEQSRERMETSPDMKQLHSQNSYALGQSYMKEKKFEKGITYFKESIRYASRDLGKLPAYLDISGCFEQIGEIDSTYYWIDVAVLMVKEYTIQDAYDLVLYLKYVDVLARLYDKTGAPNDYKNLLESINNGSVIEMASTIASYDEPHPVLFNDISKYAESILFLHERFDLLSSDQVFMIIENIRSLARFTSNQKNQFWSVYTDDPALSDKRKELRESILKVQTKLYANLSGKISDSLALVLKQKKDDLEELETLITDQRYLHSSMTARENSLGELQSQLSSRELVIEFLITENRAFAIGIGKDSLYFQGIDREDLADHVNQALKHLKEVKFDGIPNATNNWLFENLVQPYVNIGENIERLYIIPQAELNALPFEILQSHSDGSLLTQYDISYYDGALMLLHFIDNPEARKCELTAFVPEYRLESGIKDQTYHRNKKLIPIPGALEEAKSISRVWNGQLAGSRIKSKAGFEKELKKNSILHFGGHADLDSDNLFASTLYLGSDSGQVVKIQDIFSQESQVPFISLAACNTGVMMTNNGQLPSSFGHAFMVAGVPSVLMSLWQVPDASTSKIMVSFYEHLADGKRKDEALRLAKLDYLNNVEDPALKNPYYWAGFVLFGDTAPLLPHRNGQKMVLILIIAGLIVGGSYFTLRRSSRTSQIAA